MPHSDHNTVIVRNCGNCGTSNTPDLIRLTFMGMSINESIKNTEPRNRQENAVEKNLGG